MFDMFQGSKEAKLTAKTLEAKPMFDATKLTFWGQRTA